MRSSLFLLLLLLSHVADGLVSWRPFTAARGLHPRATATPTVRGVGDADEGAFPEVSAPAGFTPPEPQPLTATGDWGTLLSASAALVLRLGAGALVTGWSPSLSLSPPSRYSSWCCVRAIGRRRVCEWLRRRTLI
jgi:hypothetical protein